MRKMIDFSAKTALVTGGTRGIGKAIAIMLCQLGCKVIATGKKIEGSSLFRHPRLKYLPLNFLDQKSIDVFFKEIRKLKKIDILVNNAGINIIEPITGLRKDNWESVLAVNLSGPMLMTREIAKLMKKQRQGKILNISSILGIIAREKRNSYSSSKSGLLGLTRACALDLAGYNILVNALCPGYTLTDLTRSILSKKEMNKIKTQIPLQRLADVKEIAAVAAFLCSDLNTYITGQAIVVDGGVSVI